MKKQRSKLKSVIITAFYSTRKQIRIFFLISLLSVILIELIFKQFEAPSQTFYRAGDIFLKLCYSIVASSIFLFINQQIPREEKKIKTFYFVHNKIAILCDDIIFIVRNLGLETSHGAGDANEITEKAVSGQMSKINPRNSINNISGMKFTDWSFYFLFLQHRTKSVIQELLPLHDTLDSDLMECLFHIENEFTISSFLPLFVDNNWQMHSRIIYSAFKQSKKAKRILENRYMYTKEQATNRYETRNEY